MITAALNYNTIQFLVFFALLYVVYLKLKHHRSQNILLLIASYLFYASFNVKCVVIIFLSSIIDFLISRRLIFAAKNGKKWLVVGIAINVATLGFFKYYDFFTQNVVDLLHMFGMNLQYHSLHIIIPLGISFFTFQKIGYLVDVYNGRVRAIEDLPTYLLFVAFFPKLLSGPIEISEQFIPQLRLDRIITKECFKKGLLWIVTGYFIKMVVADALGPLVDRAFDYPSDVSGITALFAVIAYSFQIYADFAGYTLIVRGISELMGFHLMENFMMPYHSRNPREFWSRWHMSLSIWIRNYIYIPLGGNRKGNSMTYVNLMLTMFIAGLWHGAGWNYAIWGLYHGALLSASHFLNLNRSPGNESFLRSASQILITFLLVSFGWLFFKTQNLTELGYYLHHMVANFWWDSETSLYCRTILPTCMLFYLYDWIKYKAKDEMILMKVNPFVGAGVYAFLLFCVVSVGFKPIPFIYYQY